MEKKQKTSQQMDREKVGKADCEKAGKADLELKYLHVCCVDNNTIRCDDLGGHNVWIFCWVL